MKENLLIDKSIAFASRIIKLHQYLIKTKKETIISKQIVRSGTSIGANINEANYGQSKADFVSKLHIALKETAETEYWLKLLTMSEYITEEMGKSFLNDCLEINRLHQHGKINKFVSSFLGFRFHKITEMCYNVCKT